MDLDKLEALAKDVPARVAVPWKVEQWRAGPAVIAEGSDWTSAVAQMVNAGPRTAAYIAAADPQTVLKLIAALREAERVLTAYGAGDEAPADLMGEPT